MDFGRSENKQIVRPVFASLWRAQAILLDDDILELIVLIVRFLLKPNRWRISFLALRVVADLPL